MGGVGKSGAIPDTSCGEGAAPHLQAGWHQPISPALQVDSLSLSHQGSPQQATTEQLKTTSCYFQELEGTSQAYDY